VSSKTRLLHGRLAGLMATLRHGEMIYIADAGSGSQSKSLVPMDSEVEVIDLAIAPGCPSLAQLLPVLCAAGDIEAAIVTEDMRTANPEGRKLVADLVGEAQVHEVTYLPDMYLLRDRCRAFVQTGDYSVHGNVVLVGGYPSPAIPVDWLTSSQWWQDLVAKYDRTPVEGA
jgi:D-ribose pyranase